MKYYVIYDNNQDIIGFTNEKTIINKFIDKRLNNNITLNPIRYIKCFKENEIDPELKNELDSNKDVYELFLIDKFPIMYYEYHTLNETIDIYCDDFRKCLKEMFKLTNILKLSNNEFDKIFKMLYLLSDKYGTYKELIENFEIDLILTDIIDLSKLL